MMFRSLFSIVALASILTAAAPAKAEYFTHYGVHMDGDLAVVGIIKYENTASGGGASWPNRVAGGTDTTFDQIFGTDVPRTTGIMLGMSYDGFTGDNFPNPTPPDDAVRHAVLFVNEAAGAAMIGVEFSDLFGVAESDVITWLEGVGQIGSPPLDQTTFDTYSNNLDTFVNSIPTAWFGIPLPGADPGTYSVIMFSDGQLVGNGTVTQSLTSVPEPSGIVLALAGIAGMVVVHRRRSR